MSAWCKKTPTCALRFQELPKAQADILSAGLRNNPFLFGNVGGVPYGSYSPQRPGGVNYEVTVIQSWDVNQKRLSRVRVARMPAMCWNVSIRTPCGWKSTTCIPRTSMCWPRVSAAPAADGTGGTGRSRQSDAQLVEEKQAAQTDLDRADVQREMALMAVQDASAALARSKPALAVLLNLPPGSVDCLELRGAIGIGELTLPTLEELLHVAQTVRPDLNAYRLGIQRAQSEVQLARADRWADVFVLYTPWQLQDNSAIGSQNATSWSLGRARHAARLQSQSGQHHAGQSTVAQTIIELQGREQQVNAEVRAPIWNTKPRTTPSSAIRATSCHGRGASAMINCVCSRRERKASLPIWAQKEYNDVVRQYLETAVRHRRSAAT